MRLFNIESNGLLKLVMVIDPRFAYDEDYLKSYEWDILEEEIIDLLMKS